MSIASASGAWDNPPPPGTVDHVPCNPSSADSCGKSMKEITAHSKSRSRSRSLEVPERRRSASRSSRSKSPSRDRKRSHHRRRRSHSRSHSRDYSHKSRSHSSSHKRRSHKKNTSHRSSRSRHSRSRSRSPSRSQRHRSRSRSRSHSSGSFSDRDSSFYRSKAYVPEVPKNQDYIRKVYSKQPILEEVPVQENTFKNDGSFLEMFKKMQEEKAAKEQNVETPDASTASAVPQVKKPVAPIFGKRRGGKVLKTGLVEKLKNPNEIEEEPKDAWSVYMKEVKRYKEACCDDDSKTRPLVK